jgi:hypothetical protein
MQTITVILVVGITSILAGCISLNLRRQMFAKRLSSCPTCGKEVSVRPDPGNSRFVLQCENNGCRKVSFRQVRASALSLFGVVRCLLVFLAAALSYLFAEQLGWNLSGRLLAIFGGLLIGWIVVSIIVRQVARIILACNPSPVWQNEIIAHLAPPPFRNGQKYSENLRNQAHSTDRQ